jgi:hypothetical protein
LSNVAPAHPDRDEPTSASSDHQLRRWQIYAGVLIALGVTLAWVLVLIVLVWRVVGVAIDLAG